jgi:hypothetical protein
MENLTRLMQLIDANSDNLSEGVYLEMCNSIKEVHNYIHSEDNDDNNYIFQHSDRYRELEMNLHTHVIEIERLTKLLDNLCFRKRLSPQMKTDAIHTFAIDMRLDSLREYTEDAIKENTNCDINSIYKWYKLEYNKHIRNKRDNLKEIIEGYQQERDAIIAELSREISTT